MASTVEWDAEHSQSPVRAFARYAVVGLFGGFLIAIAVAALAVLVRSIAAGRYDIPALIALLALVGGPLSLRYLWPMLTDPEQRPPLAVTDWRPRPRLLAGSVVLGAAFTIATSLLVDGGHLLVLALWFVLLFGVSFTGMSGRIDPRTDTLSVERRTGTLSAIRSVRRLDVGSWTVFLLTYTPAPAGAPRIVVVPEEVADNAHSTLEFGAALDFASGREDPASLGRRPLAIAAACCLLVALGFWYVGGAYADSPMALAPGIGLFAVLGLLFVWLAYER